MVILITRDFEECGKKIVSRFNSIFEVGGKRYKISNSSIPLLPKDYIVYVGAQKAFGHKSRKDFVLSASQESSISKDPVDLKTRRIDTSLPQKLKVKHYKKFLTNSF
jgi:hypothetical protein